jgi:hypothetical protein
VRVLGPRVVAVGVLSAAVLLAAGCGGRRIEQGVFHAPQGYRVRIPGPEWTVVDDSRADLQLRTRDGLAGMLVHATCEAGVARRPADVLQRQLLLGLRERRLVERNAVTVAGRRGIRTMVESVGADDGARVRVETVTVTDGRCVYDLMYVSPVDVFTRRRADFDEFVASFVMAR